MPHRRSALLIAAALAAGACGTSSVDSAPTSTLDSTVVTTAAAGAPVAEEEAAERSTEAPEAPAAPIVCTPVPASTTTVATLPPWGDGVERSLHLQIGRQDTRSSTQPDGLSLTPVHLSSATAPDRTLTLTWESEATALDGLGLSAEEADNSASLLDEVARQRFVYRLDADRFWLGADNTDEIRAMALQNLEAVGALVDDESIEQVRRLYASMSDDDLAQLFTEDPQLYHGLEGFELSIDEPLEAPDLLPNAFGGEAFPATTSIEIAELVDDDGCVAITLRTVPNSDEFARILVDTLGATFRDTDTAELEAVAEGFEIENLVTAQYDAGSGFFRSITGTQRISDGSTTRVDTKIITDVTPG